MSTPILVEKFYKRIWNDGDLGTITDVLSSDFVFRGSLGSELIGHEAFKEYLGSIRGALADYHCEIIQCVAEGNYAFAKMRFSGRHVGSFRGYAPTGRDVSWLGAALFLFKGEVIRELWVLGDLAGLDAVLKTNEAAVKHNRNQEALKTVKE